MKVSYVGFHMPGTYNIGTLLKLTVSHVKTEMVLNDGKAWFGKEEDEPLF